MRYFLFLLLWIPLFSEQLQVKVSVPRAILINADTGAVLYEKNADENCFPASTTKIATLLYAVERLADGDDFEVVAAKDDVWTVLPSIKQAIDSPHPPYRLETDGTMLNIRLGEKVPIRTLLYAVAIASGNDVSNMLARAISGSIPQFVQELNHFLRENGILNTHFYNPHGLHYHQHVTTARDLAKLGRLAMQNPKFQELVRTVEYRGKGTNKRDAFSLRQTNALLRKGKHYYKKATGIKTGNTKKAGYTLVASAEDESRSLIAVVLGAETSENRFKDTIALFDAAFAEKKRHRILFDWEHDLFSTKVPGAKSLVQGQLKENIALSYFPSEEPNFHVKVSWETDSFPIEKGALVGNVLLVDEKDQVLYSDPIFATKRVEETVFHRLRTIFVQIVSTPLFRPAIIVSSFGLFSFGLYVNLKRRSHKMRRNR